MVALGFVLCALLVLLTGRIFWNLAMRLGASRNTKQIPIAMLELQADRDRLRAEHAIMSRKLELRLDDIKMRMTEQMAEVSRSRNRVQSLVEDIAEKNASLQAQQRSIESLNSQVQSYSADLVSCTETIKHLTSENETLVAEKRQLSSKLAEVTSTLKMMNTVENRRVNEGVPSSGLSSAFLGKAGENTAEDRIKQRIVELTNLSVEMNSGTAGTPAEAQPEIAPPRPLTLDQKLADAEHEAKAMTEELRALDLLLQPPTAPSPEATEKTSEQKANAEPAKSGAMANVISLAQRIKALQLGVKE